MWWNPGDRRALDAALALFRASFDRSRIPDERVRGLLEAGVYRLALDGTVSAAGAGLRAMALVARFPAERFLHLDYLATAPAERRQGIATRLVRFLVEEARAEGLPAVTVECDDAMLGWYGGRGALRMGFPYLFPSPLHGPLPMNVLTFPLDGATALGRARATEVVRTIYRVIHGRTEPDAVLCSVLERIPEPVELASGPRG